MSVLKNIFNFEFSLSERTKKLLLAIALILASFGFANLFGIIENLEENIAKILTALASAYAVIQALYVDIKDAFAKPKKD